MRTKLLLPLFALFSIANEFGTAGGGGAPAKLPELRENAIDGSELTIDGITFLFKAEANPENVFEVQIGATADDTDAALLAAMHRAAEFVPEGMTTDQPVMVIGSEGQAATASPPEESAPPSFSDSFPDIGEWFARVQKWAQFNSRPIPELTPEYEAAFAAEELPTDAASRLCTAKADFGTANG